MFSNGFNPSRRSLIKFGNLAAIPSSYPIRFPRPGYAVPSGKGLFVCLACLARKYGSKHRGNTATATKSKNEPFLKNSIKTLENHVQFLKSSFKEMVDRRTKAGPSSPISERDTDSAYEALMLDSPSMPLLQNPKKSIYQLLPARFLHRLGLSNLQLIQEEAPNWSSLLEHISASGGFKGLSCDEIDTVIRCMDPTSIAQHTALILGLVREAGLQTSTRTYDLLMMGNASNGDLSAVKDLFSKLKEQGCKPSVYSYGHLLKALAASNDVVTAAGAFKEMQEYKIEPNLTVYTMLLHICIRAKEINVAWKVFNLMKYRGLSTHPDVKVYSLMIHACAVRAEVEKALDLFDDMTTRQGIEPTAFTYDSIIHACAARKDYYSQAWQFARDMQSKGMSFTSRTLNLLLLACGRIGELSRARMLLRHMMAASAPVSPDEETFQAILRAYANYRPQFTKKASKEFRLRSSHRARSSPPEALVHLRLESTDRKRPDDRQLSSQIWLDFDFLSRACPNSHPDTVDEAKKVYDLVKKHYPKFVSTQLTNSLLEVYLNQGYHDTLKRAYSLLYKSANVLEEPNSSDFRATNDLKFFTVNKNIYTFEIALQSAYKSRNIGFARQIMSHREQYVRTPAFFNVPPQEQDDANFNAERIFIDTLARCEFLGEACQRLKAARNAFERSRWKRDVLKTVRIKAVQLEDMETALFLDTFASDGWEDGEWERKVQEVEGAIGWELGAQRSRNRPPRKRQGPWGQKVSKIREYEKPSNPQPLSLFSIS